MIPRIVFGMLIAVLALIAIPFGSNRMWAWGLLAVIIGLMLLAMAVVVAFRPDTLGLAWARYRVLAIGYLVVLAWMLVQASPLVPAFLHHPLWAEASRVLEIPLAGAIAVDRAGAAGEAAKFAAYGGIFWLSMQFAARDRRARIILWAILFAASLNALYGLTVYFTGNKTVLWFPRWAFPEYLSATFVNRNHFATYAGIAIVVGFGFLVEELRRISAGFSMRSIEGLVRLSEAVDFRLYLILGLLGTLGLALIFTASRGAMVSVAIGLAVFLLYAARSQWVSGARVMRFGLILLVVATGALAFTGDRLAERLELASRHASGRIAAFKGTVELIAERPLLGTGGGSFEGLFHSVRPESMGASTAIYDHAHNTYLEFGLEHGLPALFIMLAMGALVMAVCLRGTARRRRNDLIPAVGAGATALVAAHAMVDFSLEIPAVAATYLAVAGVAYAQSFKAGERLGAGAEPEPGLDWTREPQPPTGPIRVRT